MPRPLKPYKVDDVRSPNGYTTADVMFDRDRKEFFVEIVPGDRFSRVTADLLVEVKKKAITALAAAQKYEWTPLIEVEVTEAWYNNNSDGIGSSIRFEFRRFERSPNPAHADRFVERPHPLDCFAGGGPKSTHREQHRDTSPYSGRDSIGPADDDKEGALLPYRQDVWDGLVAIQQSITAAREKLDALLKRKDVGALLVAAARGLERDARGLGVASSIALLSEGKPEGKSAARAKRAK
jgi:hypothetical protein